MPQASNNPYPMCADQCPAYILAGGRSSRFGSDKARVLVGNSPLLLVLRRELIRHGHSVEIVADRADRYSDLGVQCLVDWQADQGPVAGVATALRHRQHQHQPGWLLLLSCDLLVWRGTWFEQLSNALQCQPGDAGAVRQELDAIAFARRGAAGELQAEPFPSLLHSRLWTSAVALLDRHRRALQTLFSDARTVTIAAQESPQAWTFNTVEQLQTLRS